MTITASKIATTVLWGIVLATSSSATHTHGTDTHIVDPHQHPHIHHSKHSSSSARSIPHFRSDSTSISTNTHRDLQESTSPYIFTIPSISLLDISTNIPDIKALHNNKAFSTIANIEWEDNTFFSTTSSNTLNYQLFIDGVLSNSGSVNLDDSRALPTEVDVGTPVEYDDLSGQPLSGGNVVTQSGSHVIEVKFTLDDLQEGGSGEYMSFAEGASFVPLIMVLLFASTTQMVELSLGMGVFVGSCMITGSLTAGFRTMLDTYILEALASVDHGFVYLFILFMAGLVGLIEKSGGLIGVTHAMKRFVTSAKKAQWASFICGIIIFFDDYANTLVAGASMRPLADARSVSREKLAFVVDATAAPIASIIPISSWVGFEVSLIQSELNKILAKDENPEIQTSAFAVFLETIKYRYYCIFMLMLMPLLIGSGRDFGPMLIAERKTFIYGRTDGGPGGTLTMDGHEMVSHNAPAKDTPCKWWNMAIPILMLIFYIFYLLVWTGDDGSGTQNFMQKIEGADAYAALLWGTMGAAITAVGLYFIQDKYQGRIIFFNLKGYVGRMKRFGAGIKKKFSRNNGNQEQEALVEGDNEEEEEQPRLLMNYVEAMSSFLVGMEKIFGAAVVLTLAWASGSIMEAVGLNRFFGDILQNPALDPGILPTLTFITAMLIAFATGTSWGTMTIMFPLVLVPSYNASDGNPTIFYGVTAGILAGAVAGDHASPISDTTILASMASQCQILQHVRTQAPYALLVAVWSVLVGTLPSGRGAFGNGISILLGFFAMLFHTVCTAEFTVHKTGRFDIFTEIYMRVGREKTELIRLKEDVKRYYETKEPVPVPESEMSESMIRASMVKKLDESEDELVVEAEEVDLKKDIIPKVVKDVEEGKTSDEDEPQAVEVDEVEKPKIN